MLHYPHNRCLAVVPAYNEQDSILGVIQSLREHASDFDILVIDDGSTDDTLRLAEAAGAHVLRLPYNLGIGGAVQAGFTFALEHGYDRMVQVDGDGQHDPGEIHRLMTAMRSDPSLDVVCGSRFLTEDHRYPAPISRRTGIHIFAFILSRIMGQRVSDPTSGFRLYNDRAIALFARDYPHDYPEVEAVLMVHHHRLQDDRGARCGCSCATAACRRSGPASPSTTWSRCCWPSSSGWHARVPIPEPG